MGNVELSKGEVRLIYFALQIMQDEYYPNYEEDNEFQILKEKIDHLKKETL